MERRLWRRLLQAEALLPAALEVRTKRRERFIKELPGIARNHAAAVATIVLFGSPKIDESLTDAWARADFLLKHYDVAAS